MEGDTTMFTVYVSKQVKSEIWTDFDETFEVDGTDWDELVCLLSIATLVVYACSICNRNVSCVRVKVFTRCIEAVEAVNLYTYLFTQS